jgi:hypothetical protein
MDKGKASRFLRSATKCPLCQRAASVAPRRWISCTPRARRSARSAALLEFDWFQAPMPDDQTDPSERAHIEPESTFSLIERARAGDEQALERLFARHLKPLQ